MRPASHRDPASSPLLYAALLGLMFLAVVAMLSLPAARGGSAIGLLPLWLLVLPAASLVALLVRDRLLAPSPITATGPSPPAAAGPAAPGDPRHPSAPARAGRLSTRHATGLPAPRPPRPL